MRHDTLSCGVPVERLTNLRLSSDPVLYMRPAETLAEVHAGATGEFHVFRRFDPFGHRDRPGILEQAGDMTVEHLRGVMSTRGVQQVTVYLHDVRTAELQAADAVH